MALPAGDPFSAFAGGLGGGLGKGLGDAIGGGGGGPMISGGGRTDARSGMDGSGWTVSTGGGRATGGARTGGMDMSGGMSGGEEAFAGLGGGGQTMAGVNPLLMIVMIGLAVMFIKRGGKL